MRLCGEVTASHTVLPHTQPALPSTPLHSPPSLPPLHSQPSPPAHLIQFVLTQGTARTSLTLAAQICGRLPLLGRDECQTATSQSACLPEKGGEVLEGWGNERGKGPLLQDHHVTMASQSLKLPQPNCYKTISPNRPPPKADHLSIETTQLTVLTGLPGGYTVVML